MQSRVATRRTNTMMLFGPTRAFRKSHNADFYNRRFTPSQGNDNNYVYTAQTVWGPNGGAPVSDSHF